MIDGIIKAMENVNMSVVGEIIEWFLAIIEGVPLTLGQETFLNYVSLQGGWVCRTFRNDFKFFKTAGTKICGKSPIRQL